MNLLACYVEGVGSEIFNVASGMDDKRWLTERTIC